MIKLKNVLYNTNHLLLEVSGYRNVDILVDDLITEKINIDKFDNILDSYINEAIYNKQSVINIFNKFIEPLLKKTYNIIEKYFIKGLQIISKILDILYKFKEKYPVFTKVMTVSLFLFIIFGLQSEVHASVISHGEELSNDAINTLIGVAEKAGRTLPTGATSDLDQFQYSLLNARDNVDNIVDLSKSGDIRDMYMELIDWVTENKKNNAGAFDQILDGVIDIGEKMSMKFEKIGNTTTLTKTISK